MARSSSRRPPYPQPWVQLQRPPHPSPVSIFSVRYQFSGFQSNIWCPFFCFQCPFSAGFQSILIMCVLVKCANVMEGADSPPPLPKKGGRLENSCRLLEKAFYPLGKGFERAGPSRRQDWKKLFFESSPFSNRLPSVLSIFQTFSSF